MAQNKSPIFTLIPVVSFGTMSAPTAMTRSDGVGTIGTDIFKIFTADSTDGSFVSKVRICATATTPTTMTASVIRVYISSITSGSTTASDTVLYQEVPVAAIPAANATNSVNYYEVPFGFALAPSQTILVSIHAAMAANSRWQFLTIAGDYS